MNFIVTIFAHKSFATFAPLHLTGSITGVTWRHLLYPS